MSLIIVFVLVALSLAAPPTNNAFRSYQANFDTKTLEDGSCQVAMTFRTNIPYTELAADGSLDTEVLLLKMEGATPSPGDTGLYFGTEAVYATSTLTTTFVCGGYDYQAESTRRRSLTASEAVGASDNPVGTEDYSATYYELTVTCQFSSPHPWMMTNVAADKLRIVMLEEPTQAAYVFGADWNTGAGTIFGTTPFKSWTACGSAATETEVVKVCTADATSMLTAGGMVTLFSFL